MTKLGCAVALCCACAAGQTVSGTVVNSVTNAGIPGIQVEISQGTSVNRVSTDLRGRFRFDNLNAGVYSISYLTSEYGFPRPRRFEVRDGIPVTLEARLTPSPHLTGRVVDEKGVPVPRAVIQLRGASSHTRPADGDGRFEVHAFLAPGDYTLSATPPPGFTPPDPEPDGHARGWARTFYPGTAVPEAASKIPLRPGSEPMDIEIKLLTVPAHAVRGVCLNPDGSPAAHVKVSLVDDPPLPAWTIESKADGSFEFPAVVDGEWNLAAEAGAIGEEWRAGTTFDIRGHEVENLKLRLGPPLALTGTVRMEVPEGAPAPKMPNVYLHSHRTRNMDSPAARTSLGSDTAADGSFAIDKVYPGSYSIDPTRPPSGYYLDSIRLGGVEVTTREVEIVAPTTIAVTYKRDGGAVRGTVENCSEGSIWLIPMEAGRRPAFFRFAPCLDKGRYQFADVRPGEYYAVPVAGAPPGPWLFGDFDELQFHGAPRITVRAGEITAADLAVR